MDLQDMLTKPTAPLAANAAGRRTSVEPGTEPDQRFAEAVDAEQQDGKSTTSGNGDDPSADPGTSERGADNEDVRRDGETAEASDADADTAATDPAAETAALDRSMKRGAVVVVPATGTEQNLVGGSREQVTSSATGKGDGTLVAIPKQPGETAETQQANLLRGLDSTGPGTPQATIAQTQGTTAPTDGDGDVPSLLAARNGQQAAGPSQPQGLGASSPSQQSSAQSASLLKQDASLTQQPQATPNTANAAPAVPTPEAAAPQAAAAVVQDRTTQRADARTAAQERRAAASEASALDAATVKSTEARAEQPPLRGQGENVLPTAVAPRGASKQGAIGQYQSEWVQAQQTAGNTARATAPSQAAPLPADFATPAAVERHIAPQIVTAVGTRASGGVVEIMLDPPELGRVEISIDLSETTLRATISAERAATGDLLRRYQELLNQQFAEAGFDQVDLGFSAFADGEQGEDSTSDDASPTGLAELDPSQPSETQHARSSAYASVGMDLRL